MQVKTCTCFSKERWGVTLCTRGGNQSWSGLVKRLDPSRYDFLFVLAGDGRRWFIPSDRVSGGSHLLLGGPKYAEFEIEPGDAIPKSPEPGAASTIAPTARGDVRVAKGVAL